jgi:hypothetical protein
MLKFFWFWCHGPRKNDTPDFKANQVKNLKLPSDEKLFLNIRKMEAVSILHVCKNKEKF